MKFVKICAALSFAGLVGACGSSSGGDGGFGATLDLLDDAEAATPANVADLPSSASMSGGLQAFVSGQDAAILGTMTVGADFDNATVTGSATNLGLYEVTGSFGSSFDCLPGASCSADQVGNLDGSLDLTGTIAGNTFDGDLQGDISGSNAEGSLTGDIQLDVDGQFLEGVGGLLATADLSGTGDYTTTVDGVSSSEQSSISGIFVVSE